MVPEKSILTAAFIMLAIFSASASGQTTLSISPSPLNVSLYSSLTSAVNVTIGSVNYLYGYQYEIEYDYNALTPYTISEGPFLRTGGSTYCIPPNTSTQGRIRNIACTRTGAGNVSGTGNLTRLVFNLSLSITPPITTQIRLANSKLSDMNSQAIAHTVVNGTINIKACLSGETKPCGSNVGECRAGTQACLPSDAWNTTCGGSYIGPVSETCNGRDDDCDSQADENVTGSGNLSRSCSLFHSGICSQGSEICNGVQYAGCPASQMEICYNGIDEDCDGSDSTCKGDVNGDHCIDIQDLAVVALDFGKTSGFINPNADIDKNSVVDIFDLVYVGKDFGVGCT